jgi:hypothetical protein
MIVAIHQPQYIPWLGYMNKLANADIFVFLDTVQYKKNEWQNRNRIKTASGWQWMTVPVYYRYPEKILEIKIHDKVPWRKKHWKSLVTNYSRAPYFHIYADFFHDTFSREWELLTDLNIHITKFLADIWGLKAKTVRASQLGINHMDPTTRLVAICKKLGADKYLCGKHGPKYMNIDQFYHSRIKLLYQEFRPKVYQQLFEGFIPDLSSVDLLFNCGPEGRKIIDTQLNSIEEKQDQVYECIGDWCSPG